MLEVRLSEGLLNGYNHLCFTAKDRDSSSGDAIMMLPLDYSSVARAPMRSAQLLTAFERVPI